MNPAKQQPATRVPRDTSKPQPASDPLRDSGDALLRAAVESCHQHERVADLLAMGCGDDELRDGMAICDLADRQLASRTKGYEAVAVDGKGKSPDDGWRAANTLWHASREYARRHRSCDKVTTTMNKHSSEKLGELTLEYELEASALLALRQAIAAYRKVRPKAG
ncbi:MAG: hypothetical protein ACHQQ3_08110 [Gemmatimonadales bacterium]